MFRSSSGSAAVEFALALPILLALVIPALQLARVSLLPKRVWKFSRFRWPAALAADAVPASDLTAAAEVLTAGVRPAVTCTAGARTLTTIAVVFPRRPRAVEVIDVDLFAEGPRLAPGVPTPLRAHGRDFRWARP